MRAYETPAMDRLADLLAENVSVPDAGRKLGLDYRAVNALFQRMRKRLGAQAR